MAERYFSVCEDIGNTEPAFEYQRKYGKKYISHAQKVYAYIPENFREEYGYATEKRCRQEIEKMRRELDRIHVPSASKYKYTCEIHTIPDKGDEVPG